MKTIVLDVLLVRVYTKSHCCRSTFICTHQPLVATNNQKFHTEDIEAAEARVAAQHGGANSYGDADSGSSASGAPAAVRAGANDGMKPIYSGS
jgi:hypothetical protein